jgi:hypothetical protein
MFAMIKLTRNTAIFFFLAIMCNRLHGQKTVSAKNPVYVDSKGVLRWTKDKKEAAFFGVNYTTPFAYAYRAHKALNADLEKSIRMDVYQMARLGLDAFRVHVWDTEISDSLGNLLENEHLRLFDFLLAELKKRKIKTIVTPIAFWGNGYPERDERTPGFARVFGKGRSTVNDTAIRAQENYLQQFFKHVNPYTRLTYQDDPDIIAMEINNEPSHSGPKQGVTDYINRLAVAVRSTGWTKPVYYNIAQNPYYADAVSKANIDGVSFQWYPSGLVANSEVKGNYLPHVDKYSIPFDTIPEYRNKSRMVYEFDAADILQSYMYPAMAKSFREAGMQWATQFAYDPTAIAYANTEYQTHYLNLAYTPGKAISLLIASEVFHQLPRLQDYGRYPTDSVFGPFRLSYKERLSEMNSPEKFFYSNTTSTQPVNPRALKAIAGVCSSPVAEYEGTGAYFLDKIDDGVWRMEIMPDAIVIRDPFERASPSKEVTRLQYHFHRMKITLAELGNTFEIIRLDGGAVYHERTSDGTFRITPGTFLVTQNSDRRIELPGSVNNLGLKEFWAPVPSGSNIILRHDPLKEVSPGKSFIVSAKIAGIDSGVAVNLQVSRTGAQPRNIQMTSKVAGDYEAEIPADLVVPGILNYRIIIRKGNDYVIYPGAIDKNPFAWDNYRYETWETWVAAPNSKLVLFDPATDRSVRVYPPFRRNFQTGYTAGDRSGQLIFKVTASEMSGDHIIGFQHFIGDKLKGRTRELNSFDKIVVRARTTTDEDGRATIRLIDVNGQAFSFTIYMGKHFFDFAMPLNKMAADSAMLLPRPYPGFQSLYFKGSNTSPVLNLADIEKIEVTMGADMKASELNKPCGLEIEGIWLDKKPM